MMRRREIEAKIALYNELTGILGAMKSFALVELRRVTKREDAENRAMENLKEALADMSAALPPTPQIIGDIWLLFGSARGFCGSFNEDILREWQASGDAESPIIAVGERLSLLLPENSNIEFISGATGASDANEVITNILSAISILRNKQPTEMGLIACLHDEHGATIHRVLPLSKPDEQPRNLPLTNEPPVQVATKTVEHYLFHSLFALLLRSLYVENHMRLMQMENAISHLERGTEEMRRKRNRIRQEEIVEEIELVAGGVYKLG